MTRLPPTRGTEQVQEDLKAFLRAEILDQKANLDSETPLTDAGIDSFALIEVMLFVERQYGVELPIERLDDTATKTVGSLAHCIHAWLSEARH